MYWFSCTGSGLLRALLKVDNADIDIMSANWLLPSNAGDKHYYYHYDGLGSIIALTDMDGQIVETYEYDVFGSPVIRDKFGVQLQNTAVGNFYMFTARQYDPETGNYYYRARYYSANIGRFLQADPIGYKAGLNLYAYCGNNPVIWIDPYGLKPNWGMVWEGTFKVAGGAATTVGGFLLGTGGTAATATGVGAAPGIPAMIGGTALMVGGTTSVTLGAIDIWVGLTGGSIDKSFPDSYAEMLAAPAGRVLQEVAGYVEFAASTFATGGMNSALGITYYTVGSISQSLSIVDAITSNPNSSGRSNSGIGAGTYSTNTRQMSSMGSISNPINNNISSRNSYSSGYRK